MNPFKISRLEILALFFFVFSTGTSAQIIEPETSLKAHGEIGVFRISVPAEDYTRNVLYYLPKSIQNPWNLDQGQKTLIFMHGGGASTTSEDGAYRVSRIYIQDFLAYAELQKVILIFPNTLYGWGAPTGPFMRFLITQLKTQIAIDTDHLVLAGHSMGAMGITREYPRLTDVFSGFLALSGGTATAMHTENLVRPYLNGTPYIHINGEKDTIGSFKPLMEAMDKRVRDVEKKYGHTAKFKLIFHTGGHDYDLNLTIKMLNELFSTTRNRFPRYFYGTLSDQLFWLKAKNEDITPGILKSVSIEAEVKGQSISIHCENDTLHPKALELRLSTELLDLNKAITIDYNGKPIFHEKISPTNETETTLILELQHLLKKQRSPNGQK